jgi:hypothetical protein
MRVQVDLRARVMVGLAVEVLADAFDSGLEDRA